MGVKSTYLNLHGGLVKFSLQLPLPIVKCSLLPRAPTEDLTSAIQYIASHLKNVQIIFNFYLMFLIYP